MLKRVATFAAGRPGLTALVIGAGSATGFAPLGLWPVTLVALAILLWLLELARGHRAAFALGWLFGLGHFTVGNNWIATAFTFQAKMPAWIGWLAVPLLSVYLAVFIGLATWAAWAAWQRVRRDPNDRLPLVLLFAATWIVTEWLRSWVFTGFAWNPLAAIAVPVALPSRWLGTYGMSGLIVAGTGIAVMFLRHVTHEIRAKPLTPARITFIVAFFILPEATLLLLAPLLVEARAAQSGGAPFTLVQPNIEQGDKWDMERRAENFRKLAALSPRRADQPPRLLLWPEAAVPDYLEGGYPLDWYIEAPSFARAKLAGLLGPDDVMLTGAVKLDPLPDRSDISGARNSVFSIDARGQLGPRYDKAHLVPYGEYLPARSILSLFGIERLAPGAIDFRHGPGPRSLDLGRFGKVGVQLCYEIIFSGQVVDRANRPAFIFNPSNDAWFGSWGPPQHLAQARLRAIEEGLPVLRSTPTGISAVIDADGRVVDSIPMHRAGRIDGIVPAAHAPTPFARWGNILPLAFAVFLGLAAVALTRRRR